MLISLFYYFLCYFFHCYLETLQHLWSYRVYDLCVCTRRLCISIVVLSMFHLLSSLILILWYMNLMHNGQMERGNENPTQHLPWWLRKTTKKPQSGWSAPGFEPGTSRMRVSCVTTEPARSVFVIYVCFILIMVCYSAPVFSNSCTKGYRLLDWFLMILEKQFGVKTIDVTSGVERLLLDSVRLVISLLVSRKFVLIM